MSAQDQPNRRDGSVGGRRRPVRWALLLGLVLLAGCVPSPSREGVEVSTRPAGTKIYLSIGDSYAAGYQPEGPSGPGTTTNGFAYRVAADVRPRGVPLYLINFGCSGQTTSQMVDDLGCQAAARAPDGPAYDDRSQITAALDAARAAPGEIGLITVVAGGNDLQPCLESDDPQRCVEDRAPTVRRNVKGLVSALRTVVGDDVPIVGLTYPDAYLGAVARGGDGSAELARRSLLLFRDYLNPSLAQAYRSAGATFVDVTAATGAYGSTSRTETVDPFGVLPLPVATACRLTFYCTDADVHPTTEGYAVIAEQVDAVVPK